MKRARGLLIDGVNCLKFVSQNPFVQQAFRDYKVQGGNNMTNLLALAAEGCSKQYPTDSMWHSGDRPQNSLKDCVRKVKEEVSTKLLMATKELISQM